MQENIKVLPFQMVDKNSNPFFVGKNSAQSLKGFPSTPCKQP